MSGPVKASGLLPIILIKQKDRSIKGTLPSGQVVTWSSDQSGRPTRRSKKVMLNCYWWEPVWLDTEPDPMWLEGERCTNAQNAFELYDFGVIVDGSDGWDVSNPLDLTRMVYGDEGRYSFHVKFNPYSAVVEEAVAYDMNTGNEVGFLPTLV
jgi:hypothetical protein